MNLALRRPGAKRPSSKKVKCRLAAGGWSQEARTSLQRLIESGAGKGLPAVFDFDNTIVSGDIGEAVLAILAADQRLTPGGLSEGLCPPVLVPGKGRIGVERCSDLMEYYEAFLCPTVHGETDLNPLANGYVWATQALEGLTVAEVIAATSTAYRLGQLPDAGFIQVTPGGHKYPAPRFHPEMVELIAQLLRHQFEVWIVSASNVWSVRWMVIHGLNPLLRNLGLGLGLPAENVIGLATLLSDRKDALYKDSVLVRENREYATLAGRSSKLLRLTRHLQYPVPVYSGKVACILDAVGCNPYLCAGDSPSDHPMMRISKHRLWIARHDKPQAQRATQELMKRTGKPGWILQPSFSRASRHGRE